MFSEPKIEFDHGEYSGDTDNLTIYVGEMAINITVPIGHSFYDVNPKWSTGEGWNYFKIP